MANSSYYFYLDKCMLPIAPEKLNIKINNANKTIVTINEGQINMLKKAGLTDVEFECSIPQVKYPFAVYKSGFKEASYFMDYFESLKTRRKPFQFIVSRYMPGGRMLFYTNMQVSMESYTLTEQAKDGFDLSVKINLKQYREYSTKTVRLIDSDSGIEAEIQEQRDSTTAPEAPQSYLVEKGDCLWNIAKRIYGDGSRWQEIYEANKSVVGGNPNLIYPGQELTIPTD